MWYKILLAALYGILEGVTEWLPISSTGHLILLRHFISFPASDSFFEVFEVVIQLGAILAVLVLYFHTVNPLSSKKSPAERADTWRLLARIALAALPAAAIGLLLDDLLDAYLFRAEVVAAMLILYGILFLLCRSTAPQEEKAALPSKKQALLIGCFQVLALVPGTSRSGATMLGGLCAGLSRKGAAEFSFFLAIPTMLGASALKLFKFFLEGNLLTATELFMLISGSMAAFLMSLLAIRTLLQFVKRHSLAPFGVYRILLGALVLLTLFF